jgi:hypothetical protein
MFDIAVGLGLIQLAKHAYKTNWTIWPSLKFRHVFQPNILWKFTPIKATFFAVSWCVYPERIYRGLLHWLIWIATKMHTINWSKLGNLDQTSQSKVLPPFLFPIYMYLSLQSLSSFWLVFYKSKTGFIFLVCPRQKKQKRGPETKKLAISILSFKNWCTCQRIMSTWFSSNGGELTWIAFWSQCIELMRPKWNLGY